MSKVAYDGLLNKVVLHDHDYMAAHAIYLIDSNGSKWVLSVNPDGALVTSQFGLGAGFPMGLLLSLTYSG